MVDGTRSRRAEYAELTKQAILDAAADSFINNGYADTGLDEIGRVARVSKGAVYHHFADKPGLFAAVFEARCSAALESIVEVMPEEITPRQAIHGAIAAVLNAYSEGPELRELSRQAGQALGEGRRREIQQRKSVPFVQSIFENAAADGSLREGIDITVAARMVLELVFDGAVTYAEDPERPGYRDQMEQVLVAMVTGLLSDADSQ
ncbi:DNA-binding transcriptional regulator, AcrR family [Gordonia malaquae]|jgi:AcrR family transcriptional regulator|uniref:Putative TetR family transcriptional regulator n=1 Tax=Gordonia malaquae NBRC 108250 TaxID=1223542 RepID=M3VHE8_GORML|nr:TetR/AcrR family transcriptional regulator [Gordonia malaquae]GAC81849.1 putative TetR family transcriptional regulator [Gordonia malaquae NBRC 108250]SEB29458.1 DNA-binding transcriptional regulator, AcrR family [Gordonia malaquae]